MRVRVEGSKNNVQTAIPRSASESPPAVGEGLGAVEQLDDGGAGHAVEREQVLHRAIR